MFDKLATYIKTNPMPFLIAAFVAGGTTVACCCGALGTIFRH